ncbi:hypothetical protein OF83DRAFT_1092299 [Amylostereum chailletii]|nr:hypothetical protein OF83DRAFT_1092299 [Amylostereum chailletii]
MSDPRFARFKTDPRFRRPKKQHSKVVLDDRFKSIFQDDKSKKSNKGGRVDKYGRPLSDDHEKDNLRRFYRLENEDPEEPAPGPDYARGEILLESSDEEDIHEPSDDDQSDGGFVALGHDQSRPINVLKDSEEAEIDLDEDDFADLDAQAAAYTHTRSEQDPDEDDTPHTRRLAIVNLDWDHVRATHLYKILDSTLSSSHTSSKPGAKAAPVVRGKVISVRVFPSQFGKERMEKEEREGPPVELLRKKPVVEEEVNAENIYETGDADEYDEDALRRYQLERLRYYYAIVECDNVQVASHLVNELQGTELERSANVFDMSFVPDDMEFNEDWRDEATTSDPISDYKALDFVTDALRHSKVKLTWDQEDPERSRVTRRTLTRKEMEENDFRAYIASSSDSESDAGGSGLGQKAMDRNKMRSLLLGGGGNDLPEGWGNSSYGADGGEDDVDMEVTFMPALSEAKGGEETTLEKYQRKMKEKRKRRKEDQKMDTDTNKKEPLDGDDFFGDSGGEDDEQGASSQPKTEATKSKRERKGLVDGHDQRQTSSQNELSLLVASDNADVEPNHFDIKAIIKAEKKKGKKKRGKGKGGQSEEGNNEIQEEFSIDVKDDRFKALHEDYNFAIDPSNPRFKKTTAMSALLNERSQRQKQKRYTGQSEEIRSSSIAISNAGQNLKSLVESVKRKSSAMEENVVGKRRRT